MLKSIAITDGGADQCHGDALCGIDVNKPWKVQVIYDPSLCDRGSSLSSNKGIHVKFSPKIYMEFVGEI